MSSYAALLSYNILKLYPIFTKSASAFYLFQEKMPKVIRLRHRALYYLNNFSYSCAAL